MCVGGFSSFLLSAFLLSPFLLTTQKNLSVFVSLQDKESREETEEELSPRVKKTHESHARFPSFAHCLREEEI